MAIVVDINILCNSILDFDKMVLFLTKYGVDIESISSIENWMWENERKIKDSLEIESILNRCHIVIIKLKQQSYKDMGVYIEKVENQFLYTLWINTAGYEMLDCDELTVDNCIFYKKIIQAIVEVNRLTESLIEMVGIGLETDFHYTNNIHDTIQKSQNIMIWILNKKNGIKIQLDKFKCNILEDMYLFQRK
jgi:hypothetical protein